MFNQMRLYANIKVDDLVAQAQPICQFDALQNINSRPFGGETHENRVN